MGINNHWRNKQLGTNLLKQEQICLEFLQAHRHLTWHWLGTKGHFYQYCQSILSTGITYQGLVCINDLSRLSPKNLVNALDCLMTDDIQAAYIAINRFEIIPINDLNLTYPDCLARSLDLIVDCCQKTLRRLYLPQQVDGRHFVGVHGLDVFVYESNH
jgi:hypothetical protein